MSYRVASLNGSIGRCSRVFKRLISRSERQKDWLVHGAKLTGFSAMVNPVTPRRSELTEPENFV